MNVVSDYKAKREAQRLAELEETKHLIKFGYAPGDYLVRCKNENCKTQSVVTAHDQPYGWFIGDKRASYCRECAETRYQAHEKQRKQQIEDTKREEARKPVRAPQLTRDDLAARNENESCFRADLATTVALLVAKLHSEAEEIANDLTNPEEYGDLLTTLMALAKLNGLTPEQIFEAEAKKTALKGDLVTGNFWIPQEFLTREFLDG